ncbi:glycosyltransferase family 39 protein, partial [Streptomyces sp. T-3]|nr:glycosyltransferase family 39 protein [Streptomyces sp. T-3]
MTAAVTTQLPEHNPAEPAQGRARRRRAQAAPSQRAGALVAFLVPAAVTLAVLTYGLGDRPLWQDEHATWWSATLSYADFGSLMRHVDVVFAPFYVAMHAWIMVFGDSEAALRMPAALAMATAAGTLALLGRRLFDLRVGMLAGLVFAALPTVSRYGQEARPYAFAVAAVLVSTLLLVRAVDLRSAKGWLLYAASLPLVGFSHLVALSVLAAHLCLVLQTRRAGDRTAGWGFSGALVLGISCVIPMVSAGRGQGGQIAWNTDTSRNLLALPKDLFGVWPVAIPVLVLGLIGIALAPRYRLLLALWAVLPPLLTAATNNQLHLFLYRYLLFTVPAWLLLASVALCRLTGPVGTGGRSRGGALRMLGWAL